MNRDKNSAYNIRDRYFIGLAAIIQWYVARLGPHTRVSDDIPNDRRRTKVHKILSGFGGWTQYSLFECFLSKKELVQLRAKLAQHLNDTQDSVRFYPLCSACLDKVETVGGQPPKEDITFIV